MRLASWLGLASLCLFAGLAAAADKVAVRRSGPAQPVFRHEFTGYGITKARAEEHALELAADWLAEQGNLGWTPSPEYLRQEGVVQFGEPAEQNIQDIGPTKVVKMDLEVSPAQAAKLYSKARHERMGQRHVLLGRVLAGLLAVVVVAGGYLRLEEATRGYYTTLLRVAALAVLAAVGAGLWLVV
jgi:hypothetical protein